MTDPKWLEEDKQLYSPGRIISVCGEQCPGGQEARRFADALIRAHAHIAELRSVLEESRPWHVYCEDPWFSCPKAEDGCANDADGDDCNCCADEKNTAIDAVLFHDTPPEVKNE